MNPAVNLKNRRQRGARCRIARWANTKLCDRRPGAALPLGRGRLDRKAADSPATDARICPMLVDLIQLATGHV